MSRADSVWPEQHRKREDSCESHDSLNSFGIQLVSVILYVHDLKPGSLGRHFRVRTKLTELSSCSDA